MRKIQILDCTLRDGGRIIDCEFPDKDIIDINKRLTFANIDIVEVGFLRDDRVLSYQGNSTFFTSTEQIEKIKPQGKFSTMYVAFIDYGMFNIDTLSYNNGKAIDGIRLGFTKWDYLNQKEEIIRWAGIIKEHGYKLFLQGVNILGYTEEELSEILDMVNELRPYGFGIVDTYGAMYLEDLCQIYNTVNTRLNKEIIIDFHSHNNFQLSFALAQEIIRLSEEADRTIVIDATLNGMGKCAGNLNTELIVDYLVRKKNYNYDTDAIMDIIDEYMYSLKKDNSWGYSIPAMLAGIYKSHPNNIIYLTEKFRLETKDIKFILSRMDPDERQRYNYDYIKKIYAEYNHTKVDDSKVISRLRDIFSDKEILVIMPGATLNSHADIIKEYISQYDPIVISINFITEFGNESKRWSFWGSPKRYKKADLSEANHDKVILVSNIPDELMIDKYVVNYDSLIENDNKDFDNSGIMLFNLLRKLQIQKVAVAGFDGFVKNRENYFDESVFEGGRFAKKFEEASDNMKHMLKKYLKSTRDGLNIDFITPSMYESLFEEK